MKSGSDKSLGRPGYEATFIGMYAIIIIFTSIIIIINNIGHYTSAPTQNNGI